MSTIAPTIPGPFAAPSTGYGSSPTKRTRRSREAMDGLRSAVRDVLAEIKPATVRQTYYQLVTRGVIAKTEQAYKGLVRVLTDMRRAGQVPFGWLTDNTRLMRKPRTYGGLEHLLADTARLYRRNLWANQAAYVEVWLEKDALAGVLMDVTREFDVPLMVTRGYRAAGESASHYDYQAQQTSFEGERRAARLTHDKSIEGLDKADPKQAERIDAAGKVLADALKSIATRATAASADFAAAQNQIRSNTRSMALGLSGDWLGAANVSTNAQYDQLIKDHPKSGWLYELERGQALKGNRFGDFMERDTVRRDVRDRDAGTASLSMRGQFRPMTADAMDQFDGSRRSVEEFNNGHVGATHAKERADNATSVQRRYRQYGANLDRMLARPGRAEEVSGFTNYGDPTNTGYLDAYKAQDAYAQYGAALANAGGAQDGVVQQGMKQAGGGGGDVAQAIGQAIQSALTQNSVLDRILTTLQQGLLGG